MHYKYTLQETVKLILPVIVNFLQAIDWRDHSNVMVPTSEVFLIAVIAHLEYQQNYALTLARVSQFQIFKHTLSQSQFGRRLSRVIDYTPLLVETLATCAEKRLGSFPLKQIEKDLYSLDTKPIPICQNVRILKCHLTDNHLSREVVMTKNGKFRNTTDDDYRGLCASKHEFYYGFKLNCLSNCLQMPREYSIHPASVSDLFCFKTLSLNLPPQSSILADKAYNDQDTEEYLQESLGLKLDPLRKFKTRRMFNSNLFQEMGKQLFRRGIETLFSLFNQDWPPKVHAVTLDGLVSKIHIAVLSFSFRQLLGYGLLTS